GSLIAVNLGALTPAQFRFTASFFYLAIPVVGGLRSLNGTIAAAILFGALNDVFARFQALNGWFPIVSAALLMAVLLLYPGGLAALPAAIGRRLQPVRARIRAKLVALEEKAKERKRQPEPVQSPAVVFDADATMELAPVTEDASSRFAS